MFYNRAQAMEFAADFWDRPCKSDSHPAALGLDSGRDVPLSSRWNQRLFPPSMFEARFVFNTKTNRDDLVAVPKAGAGPASTAHVLVDGKELEDCAHFLSQCLKAGGLRIREQWSVPMLVNALQEQEAGIRPRVKTLAEKVSRSTAQAIIDAGLLKIGDMIAYSGDGKYKHSAMFTGMFSGSGRITCHTKSRFMGLTPTGVDDAWHLGNPGFSFTLLHIAELHAPALGNQIAGWWKVPGRTAPEYYYVNQDGSAVRTSKPPQSTKQPYKPVTGDNRGYWFPEHACAKFCWRADGSVAVLRLEGDRKSGTIIVGANRGTATKLP
jgi:hypothetical protein